MRIETRFSVGDTVWLIGDDWDNAIVTPCDACEGVGRFTVPVASGSNKKVETICDLCYGDSDLGKVAIRKVDSAVVTRVGVEVFDFASNLKISYRVDKWPYSRLDVGESKVFETREEAEAALAKMGVSA